jgi:hypothetical protein
VLPVPKDKHTDRCYRGGRTAVSKYCLCVHLFCRRFYIFWEGGRGFFGFFRILGHFCSTRKSVGIFSQTPGLKIPKKRCTRKPMELVIKFVHGGHYYKKSGGLGKRAHIFLTETIIGKVCRNFPETPE